MKEIFKQIPDYPNYEASNLGRIKSINKNLILNQRIDCKGYKRTNLYKNGNKNICVHQLVAMAFLEHKRKGMEIVVDHIDNNPLNNRLDNLQLITNRENCIKDKKDVGAYFDKRSSKWYSKIRIGSKQKYLGSYVNKQDALNAYQNELNKL